MSTIENGLRADVMRQRMEDKNSLDEGCIYIGTGNSISLDNVTIKETKGMKLSEAIQQYGGKDSYPLSDALNPQLLNTNPVNGEKKTISFYTEGSSVDLGNNCIVPSNSQGIIISNGASNITLYYSDAVEAGAFFYNGSTWDRLTQKIKTNFLEPSSPSSANLGSKDNGFNTIYTKYYNGNGVNFRPTQFKGGTTNVDIGYGYDAAGAADPAATTPKAHIDAHIFYDGLNQGELSWIKAKGIIPQNNNEINFNIEGRGTNDLIFGLRGSTQAIENYIFHNGKGTNTYSDITCKGLYLQTGMNYNSYYNPDGAPLNDPTSQNIVDNIKSINQRLYDLGFKQAYLVEASPSGALPEGTRLGTLERWGNVVLIKLDYNFTTLDLGRVVKPDGDSEWKSSWFNPESFNNDGTGTILLFEAQVKDTTGSGTTVLRLKVTRAYSDSYLSLSLDSIPAVTGLSNSITEGSVFAYKAKLIS